MKIFITIYVAIGLIESLLCFLQFTVLMMREEKENGYRYKSTSSKQEKLPGYAELHRLDHSLTGGAHYEVRGLDGFNHKIWLCPVTLFVLGTYPAYIYVKKA